MGSNPACAWGEVFSILDCSGILGDVRASIVSRTTCCKNRSSPLIRRFPFESKQAHRLSRRSNNLAPTTARNAIAMFIFDLRFPLAGHLGNRFSRVWSRVALDSHWLHWAEQQSSSNARVLTKCLGYVPMSFQRVEASVSFFCLPAFTDIQCRQARSGLSWAGGGRADKIKHSIISFVWVCFFFQFSFFHNSFQTALLSLVKRHGDSNLELNEQPEAEQAIKQGVRFAISQGYSTWPTWSHR